MPQAAHGCIYERVHGWQAYTNPVMLTMLPTYPVGEQSHGSHGGSTRLDLGHPNWAVEQKEAAWNRYTVPHNSCYIGIA